MKPHSVPVKLQVGNDIRRFFFEGETFADLTTQCLGSVDPESKTEWLALYQDDENEWVTFSSDPELKYAISLLKEGGLLRLKFTSKTEKIYQDIVPQPKVIPLVPLKMRKIKEVDAQFVAHVTTPDNTALVVGTTFTKTWRMRNSGQKPWPSGCGIGPVDATNPFGAPLFTKLSTLALSGSEVDISVALQCPKQEGMYQSYFRMFDSNGKKFGQRIRCQIHVIGGQPQPT